MATNLVLLLHNIRSTHNVGALIRTAECLGVGHIYFTGYTPYPHVPNDDRLPHIALKLTSQIHKTALGTEKFVPYSRHESLEELVEKLGEEDYEIVGLEQVENSTLLSEYRPSKKIALMLGNEVTGIESPDLALCSTVIEIPQAGKKESLNVVQATAIAIYTILFTS